VRVVCDSSTLIAFARIAYLWILKKEFGELIIPQAVYRELVGKGARKPGSREIMEADWIKTEGVKGRKAVERLGRRLHLGESEAIVLAKEIGADLVILDDEEARMIGEAEGLIVVGGLSILVQAKTHGWIKAIKPILDELRARGFYVGDQLYRAILRNTGEL
jgi:predicted nucleic acid-binding protein